MASAAGVVEKKDLNPIAPLRIWPVVVLLVLLWILKLTPGFVEQASLGVTLAGLMGPMACCLLIVLWWVLFSRANIMEKLYGFAGLVVIGIISGFASHTSFLPIGIAIFHLPYGVTAFALAAIIFRRSEQRTKMVMVAAAFGFGFWCLVRIDGIWGDFRSTRSWRWEATAEDEFVANLVNQPKADPEALQTEVTVAWPGLRGPNREGVLQGVVLDDDWKANPPKEIWRRPVGPGWSSFAVAGDRLFTQEQRGEEEAVLCLHAATGKEIWSHVYPSRFWEAVGGAGPRATPTVTSDSVYALGAKGILMRLDLMTGKLVWERDLRKDAKRKPPTWGFSSSPLLHDGTVIVHAGGEEKLGVIAYHQDTGKIRWTAPSGDHTYSSPQIGTIGDSTGIAMVSNDGLDFIKPDSGDFIWRYEWQFNGYRVLQPLFVESSVLICTGMENGTRRVDVAAKDDGFTTNEVWTSRNMKSDYNDYVPYEGFLYGFDRNIFACVDLKTGERQWKKGRYGNGQVLLLADSGQLLVITEGGDVVLVQANSEKLDERGRFTVFKDKTWNHPVIAGNRLYVRNDREAACYELKLKE